VDERPDGSRERLGVGLREGSLDDCAYVLRYGCGGGDALVVVAVAWLSEHDPEQGGPLEREPHVGDRDAGELLGGGRRRVRRREPLGELAVADHRDG
jgi:hypothetical protein